MKTAVLFSGGKDSMLALHYAKMHSEVNCLITIVPENSQSYMFHTPNINWTKEQAKQLEIPLLIETTKGEKEKELKDLEKAIKKAVKGYGIQGVVTGAIESAYQSSRVQKICDKLGIECFNPLWQKDQLELLKELVHLKFEVLIVGTFAEGVSDLIGERINESVIDKLVLLKKKYMIHIAGEGGELETFVLNCPMFKHRLEVKKSRIEKDKEGAQVLVIEDVEECR